jgi:hypothetical protein
MYTDLTLKIYPKDKTKIKEYSNNMSVKREIYEVIDESDTEKKCDWIKGNYTCTEPK